MSQYFVFVKRGDIRDFDDIYEGMIPEVISSADSLKNILSKELKITQWDIIENKKLVGKNVEEHLEVTIDAIGKKDARMITASGISKSVVSLLKS